ncbi:MAG: hypothetical protein NHF85_00505 [Candidatus Shikimatogenerans sp. JK-2022]|nr:hypothetical protein [Candidatus Shikimatogenerans bostrichidophilus]
MKLLYIKKYNKNYNTKLYIKKIINYINKINNLILNEILLNKNFLELKKKIIKKLKINFYLQYEEIELIKFIIYFNLNNKNTKFNIYKYNNIKFLFKLYKKTKNFKKHIKLIINKLKKFIINKINIIEVILIKMAIIEFFYIKNLNINIIISEYIKILKIFSSDRNIYFLNSILEKIFKIKCF